MTDPHSGWMTDPPDNLNGAAAKLPEDAVNRDLILTDVLVYWLTATAGSSARIYYEAPAPGVRSRNGPKCRPQWRCSPATSATSSGGSGNESAAKEPAAARVSQADPAAGRRRTRSALPRWVGTTATGTIRVIPDV